MAATITGTVNSSNYGSTFASVDTAKMLVEEAGTVEITTGKLHLEPGWTFIFGDLYIQDTVAQLIPADLADPSLYTLAIDDAIVIITDAAGANRISGGGIYVKRGDLRYTNAADQYQFGGFSSTAFPYFNVNGLRMHTEGGRFLFNNNKSEITSVTNDLQFTGGGQVELNVIWGSDLNGYTPPFESDNIVGVERFPASVIYVGEDGSGTGNNFTYCNDWIYNKVAGVVGPSFGPRNEINIIVNNPVLNDGQVVTVTRLNAGHLNQWVEVRRSFTPTFVDTALDPIEGVKLYIDNTTETLFEWMSSAGRTVYTALEDANLEGGFKTDYDYKTGSTLSSVSTGLLEDGGKCWYRVAKWKQGIDADDTPVVDFTGTPTAYTFKYGFLQVNIPLSNTEKAELAVTGVVDANSAVSKATAEAYTDLTTMQRIYDRSMAQYEDNFGTYLSQFFTLDGGRLNLDDYDLVADATAASVIVEAAGVITTKSTVLSGGATGSGSLTIKNGSLLGAGTYDNTGGILIDNGSDGDTYTDVIADKIVHSGTGTRTLTLSGGDVTDVEVTGGADLTITLADGAATPNAIETSGTITILVQMAELTFSNLTDATVEIFDDSGVSVQRSTAQTGTLVYATPYGSTGTWSYVVDRIGYVPLRGSYDTTGDNVAINGALTQLITVTGSIMYTGTTDTNIAVTFDLVTPCMCISVGDAIVSPQTIFDECEDALLTPDGMKWQNDYGTLVRYAELPNLGDSLFFESNIRLKRALAGDVNAAVAGYVSSVDGIVVDGTNGDVGYALGLSSQDVADAVWDEPLTGSTHNVPTSAGRRLRQVAAVAILEGTAAGSGVGTNQIVLDNDASAVSDTYDPALMCIINGTGAGQSRVILQYDGTTRTATVDRDWKINPSTDSEYIIYADAGRQHVNEGLAQAGSATSITLNALASDIDDGYKGQLVFIRSGGGSDQVRMVSAYNGTTKVATVSEAWGTIPDSTSGYTMLPTHVHEPAEIVAGLETKVQADTRQAALIAEHDATQASIAPLSTFDPTTDEVTTDAASRTASKADVSALATKSDVINASQI